jgi:hypothetical protein
MQMIPINPASTIRINHCAIGVPGMSQSGCFDTGPQPAANFLVVRTMRRLSVESVPEAI